MSQPERATGRYDAAQEPSVYQKQLDVRHGRAEAFLVEMAQWARIKRRVDALESRWSINWLATGASSAGSVAVAAAIAAVVLPGGPHTGISSTVEPVLWVLAVLSAVLACAMLYLGVLAKGERTATGADIVDEMDTIEKAWEQRKQEGAE